MIEEAHGAANQLFTGVVAERHLQQDSLRDLVHPKVASPSKPPVPKYPSA